ncbi:hypothetical protein RND81_14G188700 [Saponaria officinalis]|uniref:ATP-dependent DNA helicase n=1 Tax=Saponaria officinalis TaxID=3572 RepID=A0AAW1GVH6_SAPOF
MWYEERVKKTSTKVRVNFNMCCRDEKIQLQKLKDPHQFLKNLTDYSKGNVARKFREHIRMYNSAYAFTSMGAKIDKSVNGTQGPYTFRISGQNCHFIGSLLPIDDRPPSFIQLYVYDTSKELELRANTVGQYDGSCKLDKEIFIGLKEMIDEEDENINLKIRLICNRENRDKTYSDPTASEIAALIVGGVGETSVGRDNLKDYGTSEITSHIEMLNNHCDAVNKGDYIGAAVGKRVILPASFTGCLWYMQQNYQDAMAMCRWFGNPHLFITFTANPKWPEIKYMLDHIEGHKAEDRPDIIARVFKMKLKQLMHCLTKEHYFGTDVADVYTIEFQKRGLPHAHILLWLKKDENDISPNKKFPKSFNEETIIDNNGYPVYRRRENARHIVPYNPGLLLMFDAHINVEWCNTARAIKYLFKYILKGPDKATAVITGDKEDEINSYLDCRYLSACEAVWRIFEFEIHERNPAVTRLPVHLEGEQAVVLKDKDNIKLTANTIYPEARTLTYGQFPTKFVWIDGCCTRRNKGMSIGRMAFVHPTAGERYYLRQLLNYVKGARTFEEIRTVEGHTYKSYKEACSAMGLLNNDKEWHNALQEANQWAMPSQLRELFVTMLLFCEVTDVVTLWNNSYVMLSEDIERKKRKLSYTLIEVDKVLMRYGKSLKDINDMSLPQFEDVNGLENKLIRDERMYDRKQLAYDSSQKMQQLNKDQRVVYDKVIEAVNNNSRQVIFLFGHGGKGKTFLYSTISAKIRAEGKIVLNVASSGIAALLLLGGRTTHSRFEIPIELFDNSTCNISQNTQLAELLRETSLIIWDEAPMDHKYAFEALDRTMKDIIGLRDKEAKSKLFGRKVILLGGDFRQVLPIVSKGARQDIVQASINRSYIWNDCRVYTLSKSMRVSESKIDPQKQERNRAFNNWLLAMGDGRLEAKTEDHETEATWIKIPAEYIGSSGALDIATAVRQIYPDFDNMCYDPEYLKQRAILTPLNETADLINSHMVDLISGDEKVYESCDEICTTSLECMDEFESYSTEYLNSLNLQGMPGLCNGTRLIVTHLGKFIVESNIITGSKVGNKVLIPRIVMTTTNRRIPFVLKRRQYPLKPCYAMTINKIYMPKPVFSHGQLYVAASRTTSPEGLKFFIEDTDQTYKGHTRNIVYKEVFSNLPTVN